MAGYWTEHDIAIRNLAVFGEPAGIERESRRRTFPSR
jgi:hypothetical protein